MVWLHRSTDADTSWGSDVIPVDRLRYRKGDDPDEWLMRYEVIGSQFSPHTHTHISLSKEWSGVTLIWEQPGEVLTIFSLSYQDREQSWEIKEHKLIHEGGKKIKDEKMR